MQFCLTKAIRGITKIGFNMLAFFCESTAVNKHTFPRTVEWITKGVDTRQFGDERKFGFIAPSDVAELACPPKSHKFRLTHDLSTNTWKMYASFFVGKASIDVTVAYDRPMPPPIFDDWYRPLDTHVALNAPEILPSLPWRTGETRVQGANGASHLR
jgi:hypothetical protein